MLRPIKRGLGPLRSWAFCLMSGTAGACLAQIPPAFDHARNTSRDAGEWSGFATQQIEPERKGPVLDEQFQSLRQDGPWRVARFADQPAGYQALMAMAREGRWDEALPSLKASSFNLNVRDEQGATLLSLAARAGELAWCQELIKRGANVDQPGVSGDTPLGAASFAGHALVVRELLRAGAGVDVPSRSGQWPLHLAASTGQLKVVRMLLDAQADPGAFNQAGRHALAEAALNGQLGVMALLVDAGVSPALPDRYRLNALHAAALGAQPDAAAWLKARGVTSPGAVTQILLDAMPAASTPSP